MCGAQSGQSPRWCCCVDPAAGFFLDVSWAAVQPTLLRTAPYGGGASVPCSHLPECPLVAAAQRGARPGPSAHSHSSCGLLGPFFSPLFPRVLLSPCHTVAVLSQGSGPCGRSPSHVSLGAAHSTQHLPGALHPQREVVGWGGFVPVALSPACMESGV